MDLHFLQKEYNTPRKLNNFFLSFNIILYPLWYINIFKKDKYGLLL